MSIDSLEFEESNTQNVIKSNFEFEGYIESSKPIIIEGLLKGLINSTSSIYLREKANVKAEIKCNHFLNHGTIKGNIEALETIKIYKTGKLIGNIKTKELFIDSGAIFKGNCIMEEK
ncbi:polymer-forming cytoskeletal family protein [Borrelia sp. A-FGy1]|uniref:bactofilin family protein n=1 Tax=Borrelia sp. A-FGy1 TaxID=2608247 RepID=UPI0015F700C5|nr:polymer-forming cytoskeletal protein [Borrelia sp. A-FGy1]QMU99303.1 polymer-forming cytoskeletal family protein [Borrelia sp. A-FGy1]